jgi:hypothetical protein
MTKATKNKMAKMICPLENMAFLFKGQGTILMGAHENYPAEIDRYC